MAQDEYLHRSDILGTVGRTVDSDAVNAVVVGTVGEMVELVIAERVGLIPGRRVVEEMVAAGYWVRDEKSIRLEVVGIFIVAKGDGVGELGKGDVLENITLAKEEPLLEDTGRTVDGERLTLDEIDDSEIRGVVRERVANVDGVVVGTNDAVRVVLKRVATVDGVLVGTNDGERVVLERGATVVVFVGESDDEAVEGSGIAGETMVLETIGGTDGELLRMRVQYNTTHSLALMRISSLRYEALLQTWLTN